jgi:uncharacterized protein HemY
MKTFNHLLKFVGVLFVLAIAVYIYRLDGIVEIRWPGYTASGSLLVFSLLTFVLNILIYHLIRLFVRIGHIPALIKQWWLSKRQLSAQAQLEVAFAHSMVGQLDTSLKKLSALPITNKLLRFKQVLQLFLQRQLRYPIDQVILHSIIQDRLIGFVGYKIWLEEHSRSKDWEGVSSVLLQALRRYPSNAYFWEQSVIHSIRLGHYKDALDSAKKLSRLDHDKSAKKYLALAYFLQGEYSQSSSERIKYWTTAISLDSENIVYASAVAKEYIHLEKYEKAQKIVEAIWPLNQSEVLAEVYLLAFPNSSGLMVESAVRMTASNKNSVGNLLLLIRACIAAKFYQQARDYLNKAIHQEGKMTLRLLDLRITLTELDRAESLDASSWVKKVVANEALHKWECLSCSASFDRWTPVCSDCDQVMSIQECKISCQKSSVLIS